MHHKLKRNTLIGGLLLRAACCAVAAAAPAPDTTAGGTAAQPAPADAHSEREHAIARARAALKATGIDAAALSVRRAEPTTWPDSSLGCRRPGIQYLQVQTPGFQVELYDAHGSYAVHVGGKRAVVCASGSGAGIHALRPLAPVRGINLMTQRARAMLAALLHVPKEQIRVAALTPRVWPDTGLGCASATPAVAGRISGFQIVLEHDARPYTFNTDLHRVLACPAIAAQ